MSKSLKNTCQDYDSNVFVTFYPKAYFKVPFDLFYSYTEITKPVIFTMNTDGVRYFETKGNIRVMLKNIECLRRLLDSPLFASSVKKVDINGNIISFNKLKQLVS